MPVIFKIQSEVETCTTDPTLFAFGDLKFKAEPKDPRQYNKRPGSAETKPLQTITRCSQLFSWEAFGYGLWDSGLEGCARLG